MTTSLKAAPIIDELLPSLKKACTDLKNRGVIPSMKVLLVGEHPPSMLYTKHKQTFCHSIGAECEILRLPESISEAAFLDHLKTVGSDPKVHGCFVQLPLPEHLNHLDVGGLIPPEKDVDGFHPQNLMAIFKGESDQALVPCTPKGILTMLEHHKIDIAGKNIVVIGRSMIVGKPMASLLLEKNATVTICHSRTQNLAQYTKLADIIISAVGRPRFFTAELIRHDQSQILIDVGINHDTQGKLCGDMDYTALKPLCRAITPVPGGVGKMTIFSLAQNLLQAAAKSL